MPFLLFQGLDDSKAAKCRVSQVYGWSGDFLEPAHVPLAQHLYVFVCLIMLFNFVYSVVLVLIHSEIY